MQEPVLLGEIMSVCLSLSVSYSTTNIEM